MTAPIERYRAYLEALTPTTVADLPRYVTPDVRFSDPFHEVVGAEEMARVFRHMFKTVGNIHFEVSHAFADDESGLMAWRFRGSLRGEPWEFDGTTVLRFAADGRVAAHIDHWDAGRAFYERLPLIGPLLSWVRRGVAVR